MRIFIKKMGESEFTAKALSREAGLFSRVVARSRSAGKLLEDLDRDIQLSEDEDYKLDDDIESIILSEMFQRRDMLEAM